MSVSDFFDRDRINPQKTEVGIGGFTLLANISERTRFTSTAPTTYLEDGSFVQDHIVNNPIVLDITGDVSELSVQRPQFDPFIERAQSTLGLIGFYVGGKTQSQIQKANALVNDISDRVSEINRLLNDGVQILDFFGLTSSSNSQLSNQELFITAMEAAHLGKQLISIDMPFRTYANMQITSLTITTSPSESEALRYALQATQIRFVKTRSRRESSKNPTKNLGGQTDNKSTVGNQTGEVTSNTESKSVLGSTGQFFNTIADGLK